MALLALTVASVILRDLRPAIASQLKGIAQIIDGFVPIFFRANGGSQLSRSGLIYHSRLSLSTQDSLVVSLLPGIAASNPLPAFAGVQLTPYLKLVRSDVRSSVTLAAQERHGRIDHGHEARAPGMRVNEVSNAPFATVDSPAADGKHRCGKFANEFIRIC
jgi:hypothetical protein